MKLEFDKQADALYVRFSEKEIQRNEKVNERTIIDYDKDGEIVGFELLDVEDRFSGISQLEVDLEGAKV